jgi:hypothetical protein
MGKFSWLLRGVAMIALIIPTALMLGPAASNASAVPSANFAAQARAAHLNAPQQATLQSEVNKIIARYGGRQVALNEVALPRGASVLFPLPGQHVARVLPGTPRLAVNTAKTAKADEAADGQTWTAPNGASCPYYYFCSWQGQSYTGVQFNVSWCDVWQEYPGSGWNGFGSWVNNQTYETLAYLANSSEQMTYIVSPADPFYGAAWDSSFNWEPYWYVMACQD